MKFAMIPINRRYTGGKRIVRRILISYTRKIKGGFYKGTKVIETDPYFKNPESSQQYVFEDTCFYLVKDKYEDFIQDTLLNVKRPYQYDAGKLFETAIEFEAEDLQEAIERFNNRVEGE